MPHFRLETNVPQSEIPDDLPQKICGAVSKSLGKPLNFCVATVIGGVNLSWGGTKDRAAQATLLSIGALGLKENKHHSSILFELIQKELNIAPNKMYIHYIDTPSSDLGYNGSTFHDILG